jgi:pimeloyl-ACP methyl ester carboxylesterase
MVSTGSHTIEIEQGTTLHWAETGTGRPLVLLHGLGDTHRTWHRVAHQLSSNRHLYMLDLAGHGLSGRPDAPYDLDWHARVAGSWIDHLGLDEIDLVGHSFGGGVAQQLLLSHHERVRRLGLVSAGGLGREVALGLRLLTLPLARWVIAPFLGIGTRIALWYLESSYSAEDRRWHGWVNSMPGTARALTRSTRGVIDLCGQHRHFLQRAHEVPRLPPVAVYWGERDCVLPVAHARRMLAHVRGAELTTFSECGHFPHLERPEQFIGALSRFLDDSGARRARIVAGVIPTRRSSWFRRCLRAIGRWLRFSRPAPTNRRLTLPPAGDKAA